MKSVPTFVSRLWKSDDPAELRARITELEDVLDKYRTKRVGPFELSVKISAPTWPHVVSYIRNALDNAEKCGPECMVYSTCDSGGGSCSVELKSNTQGGHGEEQRGASRAAEEANA